MKKQLKPYLILVPLLFLVLTGCEDKVVNESNSFLDNIQVTLSEKISSVNELDRTYTATLVNTDGKFVTVDSIKLKLDCKMKNMSHIKYLVLKKQKKSIYTASVKLPMNGNWHASAILKDGDYTRIITIASIEKD